MKPKKSPAQITAARIQKGQEMTSAPKLEVRKLVAAARGSGIPEGELRKLLMSVNLGELLTETQLYDLSKAVRIERLILLKQCIAECNAYLATQGLSDEAWAIANKAKTEYLVQMGAVTTELSEMITTKATGYMKPSAHAPSPREHIGTVTAVQVNIGKAEQQTPAPDDVTPKIVTLPGPDVASSGSS